MKYYPKKALLLLLSVICTIPLFAQTPASNSPFLNDSLQLLNKKNDIRQHYLKDSASASGENKKYIVNLYRERYQFLDDMFKEKEFMANAEPDSYLSSLVNEIFKNNPQLKTLGTRFLFSKAYWPNAFSTGEGTIVFNIGLFSKLENESQVIFVLCHELAHLYLDHSNKAILQYVNTVYSEDFQDELKDIKRSKYEKNRQLEKLLKGFTFQSRRHGREHESEADSVGLVFMQHTAFNIRGSLSCLALLDSIDNEKYVPEADLQRLFNFSEYPFQKNWIRKEEAFFGGVTDKKLNSKEEDSLKTHPDCQVRITRLRPSVEKLSGLAGSDFVVSEAKFKDLKQKFRFEIIEFCFTSNRVSRSLYYAMQLLNEYPDNAYLVSMIGKCFASFYENQKEHTLNHVVDLPSPYLDKNYNTLLEFLQNIRINDMAAIGYYFLKLYESKLSGNADFMKMLTKSNGIFNNNK